MICCLFFLFLLAHIQPAHADNAMAPLREYRYCEVTPHRDSDGSISRRADVIAAYRKLIACPSTGKFDGACPGWSLDHTIPLACGGCDSVYNLTWMDNQIKRCAGAHCKDRYERKIYCKQ